MSNSWNSKSINSNTTEFHVGWINYKRSDGDWYPIDCVLTQDETGFHVVDAPFTFDAPLLSNGEAVFNVTNKWDIFNKSEITTDPFSQTIKAIGVSSVSGELHDINGDGRLDSVKYANAYGIGIHLVYYIHHGTAPRLKKLIQFDSALGLDTEYEFEITYSDKTEISSRKIPSGMTRRHHRDASEATLNSPARLLHDKGFYIRKHNESQKRGIGIKTPLIWDSGVSDNLKLEDIDIDIRKGIGANKYILTKYIKSSFFDNATYPVFTDTTSTFYPDADPETTSLDGIVGIDTAATWTAARNGTTGTVVRPSVAADFAMSEWVATFLYRVRRVFLLFDTSDLPDTDNISSAILSTYPTVINNDYTDSLHIIETAPTSNTDLVAADFNNITFSSLGTETLASMTINQYNSISITDLNKISKTGVSKLGLITGLDLDDTEPNVFDDNSRYFMSFAETAGTDQDPKLVVEHITTLSVGNKTMETSSIGNMVDGNTFIKRNNLVI